MKELSFEKMEKVQGGSNLLDCVSQVTGGMGILWGTAAAIALGSNPIGWALIGLTAIGTAASMATNPGACDSI
jgi:hypothetical protein